MTASLVLADTSNDGDGELEFFRNETDCEASQSFLTEEYKTELDYCVSAKIETVFIYTFFYFDLIWTNLFQGSLPKDKICCQGKMPRS